MRVASRRRHARRLAPANLLLLVGVAALLITAWQLNGQRTDIAPLLSEAPAGRAYHTTDAVNLRAAPSTDAPVIEVLDARTPVSVTGEARDGFLPVRVAGHEAWIAAAYLAPEEDLPELAQAGGEEIAGALTRSGLVETAHAAPVEEVPAPATVAEEVTVEDSPAVHEPVAPAAPVTTEESGVAPEPTAPDPPGERWIEVDRSTALVTLHEGDRVVATYQGKIGRDPSPDGYYSTAVGTYYVYSMNEELTETPFVEDVYLTHWVGFDPERSNGFHSPVRDAAGNVVNTQGTTTLGCVRLEADAAAALYDFAFIGMRVEVHD